MATLVGVSQRSVHGEVAEIVEIDDPAAAFTIFDTVCRRELGLDGVEFLRRWDTGDYEDADVDHIEGLSEVVEAISTIR